MATLIDVETVDPVHLAELARLLQERRRQQHEELIARAGDRLVAPAFGAYRDENRARSVAFLKGWTLFHNQRREAV